MKANALLPILRSQTQGDLLAVLYLHPEQEFTMTDLAERCGAPLPTVHHEAVRLIESGLIDDRRMGRNRLLRAAASSPLAAPLTQLLALTHGPLPVLRSLLASVPGISGAWIYGSWAARYAGEAGSPPQDIDVLVVGNADRRTLDRVADDAETRLQREVNIQRVALADWQAASPDPFIAEVRRRPMVALIEPSDV